MKKLLACALCAALALHPALAAAGSLNNSRPPGTGARAPAVYNRLLAMPLNSTKPGSNLASPPALNGSGGAVNGRTRASPAAEAPSALEARSPGGLAPEPETAPLDGEESAGDSLPLRKELAQTARNPERAALDHLYVNTGIRYGDVSPQELKAELSERIRAGDAWKVWGRSTARGNPGDAAIPYDADSPQARKANAAIARLGTHEGGHVPGHAFGASAYVSKDAMEALYGSDIVIVRGPRPMLYARDEESFAASEVGRLRRTLYVGESLWRHLLDEPKALAGFLANGLHHVTHPNQDPEAAEREARLEERRSDPEGALRALIADLAVPPPPVYLLGQGSFSGLMPLILRAAAQGRPRLDLGELLWAQFERAAPELAALLREQEARLWEELTPLRATAEELSRQARNKYEEAESFTSQTPQVARVIAGELDRVASPWRHAVRSVEQRLSGIDAGLGRLAGVARRLKSGPLPMSLDEYLELSSELFSVMELDREPPLRRLLARETEETIADLQAALGEDPLRRYFLGRKSPASDSMQDFFNALREELGESDLLAQAHEGADLYEHPGRLALGALFRQGDGRLLASFQKEALEQWLAAADPRLLAQDLLTQEGRKELVSSGAVELERAFHGGLPELERAYQNERRRNWTRWIVAGALFLAAVAADAVRTFLGNPVFLVRHLLGYLGVIVAERWAYFADHSHLLYWRSLQSLEEDDMPPGLKIAVERITERAGFAPGRIFLSAYPEPRAWALLSPPTMLYPDDRTHLDLILSKSLLSEVFDGGRTRTFDAVLGQAVAHMQNRSRLYLRLASVGFWHLLDHLDPFGGPIGWVLWGISFFPAHYLSAWIFRSQEYLADTAGSRLAQAPRELAAFYEMSYNAAPAQEPARTGMLPRIHEPDLQERAARLKELGQL